MSKLKSNDVNIEEMLLEPPFMKRDCAQKRRKCVLHAVKLGW